jgi:predicted  nucleic acid-binding Zn-ribbon protein
MSHLAERYNQLSHTYIKLADQFQKLDVDYMTLRSKVVPLLRALKSYKATVETLKQQNLDLEQELRTVTQKYEELKPFAAFLSPEFQQVLSEAEEQLALVDETLKEIDQDRDPGLSEADKSLLLEHQNDPSQFEALIQPNGYSSVRVASDRALQAV